MPSRGGVGPQCRNAAIQNRELEISIASLPRDHDVGTEVTADGGLWCLETPNPKRRQMRRVRAVRDELSSPQRAHGHK